MRVVVVVNPAAGRGGARVAATKLDRALREHGDEVLVLESSTRPQAGWLDQSLQGADRLIVVGGDGAVRMAAESAARQRVPLCQYPFGTENLLSREFGMRANPAQMLHLLEHGEVRFADLPRANGEPFLLMASIGFDADVVHDLAAHRNGSISHWSYAGPILRQFRSWKPPHLEVMVDGRRIDGGETGFVVVANSRQYGARLDPCPRADMTDGLLDVAWFPTRTRADLLSWMVRCWTGRQLRDSRLVYATASRVEITALKPELVQLDGDPGWTNGSTDPAVRQLSISLSAQRLPILVPAGLRSGVGPGREVGSAAKASRVGAARA